MARTLDEEIERALIECEAEGVDPRPWMSGDHKLSMKHWSLVQKKLNAKYEFKPRKPLSPEHKAKLKAGREAARSK